MSKCASALPDVTYSTAQVAKRYRVGIHKVLTLIGRGELAAVNVSLSARPQWRITAEALADFELRRAAQP
ncbi:MAG: helix-turn-helix domain-containing protein, partial [Planctomycetes bacterium]|nr:helix-turn-helix domain-containing protein [Planctomycetota bacterium]